MVHVVEAAYRAGELHGEPVAKLHANARRAACFAFWIHNSFTAFVALYRSALGASHKSSALHESNLPSTTWALFSHDDLLSAVRAYLRSNSSRPGANATHQPPSVARSLCTRLLDYSFNRAPLCIFSFPRSSVAMHTALPVL